MYDLMNTFDYKNDIFFLFKIFMIPSINVFDELFFWSVKFLRS